MLVFRPWNMPVRVSEVNAVKWIDMDMDYGSITMREMSIWRAQRCKRFGHCSELVKIASSLLLQFRIQEFWLAASHFISNSSLLVESKQHRSRKTVIMWRARKWRSWPTNGEKSGAKSVENTASRREHRVSWQRTTSAIHGGCTSPFTSLRAHSA